MDRTTLVPGSWVHIRPPSTPTGSLYWLNIFPEAFLGTTMLNQLSLKDTTAMRSTLTRLTQLCYASKRYIFRKNRWENGENDEKRSRCLININKLVTCYSNGSIRSNSSRCKSHHMTLAFGVVVWGGPIRIFCRVHCRKKMKVVRLFLRRCMLLRLVTQHDRLRWTDRQTDRQTDGQIHDVSTYRASTESHFKSN